MSKARQGGALSLRRGVFFLVLGLALNAAFGRAGLLAAYPLTELLSSAATAAALLLENKGSATGPAAVSV